MADKLILYRVKIKKTVFLYLQVLVMELFFQDTDYLLKQNGNMLRKRNQEIESTIITREEKNIRGMENTPEIRIKEA